jgi:glycosyltransferase involved in cell wall biosynthesis
MHIIIANQWFPPERGWGGVAVFNHAIARAYVDLGHQVTVLASRIDPNTAAFEEQDGVRIHRLLIRDFYRLRRMPLLGYYVRSIQQISYSWRVSQKLRSLPEHAQADIIEFTDVNAEGFFYARCPQKPFIVRCQTPTFVLRRYFESIEMPFDTRIISWCEKDQIRRAHGLAAPSHDMAKTIANACHLSSEEIAVIPDAFSRNGSHARDSDRPSSDSGRPTTILYVGRLERAKGVTVLADAIPQVVREYPEVRFRFVGYDRPMPSGGSRRAELEERFLKAGVATCVEFLGPVDQAKFSTIYEEADICVVPSVAYESFSYTCVQAMAAGKPVVASRIGGMPETVEDGVAGLIVEPGNADELAKAILRLIRDPGLRESLGCAGREKVLREFDPLKVAQRNLEVYERARQTFKVRAA